MADETITPRPLSELRDTGLLWLINRSVFHPLGYALGLHVSDDGEVTGWSLHGDGSEAWRFEGDEDEMFEAAMRTLRAPIDPRELRGA